MPNFQGKFFHNLLRILQSTKLSGLCWKIFIFSYFIASPKELEIFSNCSHMLNSWLQPVHSVYAKINILFFPLLNLKHKWNNFLPIYIYIYRKNMIVEIYLSKFILPLFWTKFIPITRAEESTNYNQNNNKYNKKW